MNYIDKVRTVEKVYKRKPVLIVSAPGRADFLNTHQDYKGLPVVPVAINLRTYVFSLGAEKDKFIIDSLNLRKGGSRYRDKVPLKDISLVRGKWFGNYLRGVLLAFKEVFDFEPDKGLRIVIYSDVPIGSGLASSAALEVAFGKMLDEFYGLKLSPKDLAEACFYAENGICKIPCGRLDQYSAAFGEAILLYPKPPVKVEKLPLKGLKLVVADSGIRHSVADIHPRRQSEINRGLQELLSLPDVPERVKEKLAPRFDEVSWEELSLEELSPFLQRIDGTSAKRIEFTFLMNNYTMKAVELIKESGGRLSPSLLKQIGEIMNKEHELLRDLYDVSLPELERIRNKMLEGGALGVKLSGAGMGGSLIALVEDNETGRRVANKALEGGARKTWIVSVDEGARKEIYAPAHQ